MAKINQNYLKLKESYLFSEVAKRVGTFASSHPEQKIIKMGIGDVTLPLVGCVTDAMHSAVDDMSKKETFHGYGPEQGYGFIRERVQEYYQKEMEVSLELDEIFISDGAKSDVGNITDLFSAGNTVLIPDPVYPVYVDTNVMLGSNIVYLKADESNGFCPMPPEQSADLVYLCSPNNPTGATYNREQLKAWVDYANGQGAILLFDAAYEAFVTDKNLPRSIFEIEGAKTCAIEFCSLSKTAGFTGTRCGYTIVPKTLTAKDNCGKDIVLNKLWLRRQTTKFNGVSYIVQRGAAAVFTEEGKRQTRENIDYYRKNAQVIAKALEEKGIPYFGGVNSPYIWFKCPNGMGSWEFFDFLLEKTAVVGTPGAGFGENGEGFFRLTAFGDHNNTMEAMKRMKNVL